MYDFSTLILCCVLFLIAIVESDNSCYKITILHDMAAEYMHAYAYNIYIIINILYNMRSTIITHRVFITARGLYCAI